MKALAESFRGRDLGKRALFAILGILTVSAIVTAEHFLIDPRDPEWKHIAPYRWLLLPHAIAGAIALLAGPLQFSASLRRARAALAALASSISKRREKAGLTQEDLAYEAGVALRTLQNLERGRLNPGYSTLRGIAAGFGIPVAKLLDGL